MIQSDQNNKSAQKCSTVHFTATTQALNTSFCMLNYLEKKEAFILIVDLE